MMVVSVLVLSACAGDRTNRIAEALRNIEIAYALDEDETGITRSVILPVITNRMTITWESNYPNILTADGTLIRPQNSRTITLTATIAEVHSRTFDIFVIGTKDATLKTISFRVDGEEAMSPMEVSLETGIERPVDPSRFGYLFNGWYTEPTLENEFTFEEVPAADLFLYGEFDIINYSITYELREETVNDEANPESYTIDDNFVLRDPEREGYIFAGWFTEAEFTNRIYNLDGSITTDLTLYPRWALPVEE